MYDASTPVGLTVADLDVVTAFFVALGLEAEGRTFVEGELLDTVCGIPDSTARLVLKAAARNPGHRHRSKIGPPKSAAPDQATGPEPVRPKQSRKTKRPRTGRAGVTHTRHTQIKTA